MSHWQENKADGLAKIARERSKFAHDKQAERYAEGEREAAYVIHKSSRDPGPVSYFGTTWDKAGIRESYKTRYDSKEEAERLAEILTQHNPVGFAVGTVGGIVASPLDGIHPDDIR